MVDFDLASFLSEADGEYVATFKGRAARFEVEAPGHGDIMEAQVVSLEMSARIHESEPGGSARYTMEEEEKPTRYVDGHILRIEGKDWRSFGQDLRMQTLRRLSFVDFWGLVTAVAKSAGLGDDKKND